MTLKSLLGIRKFLLTNRPQVSMVITVGFGVLIVMLTLIVVVNLYTLDHQNTTQEQLSREMMDKVFLSYRMRDAIRERVENLRVMLHIEDPFERDQLRMEFYGYAKRYSQARAELIAVATMPEERQFLERLDRLAQQVGPANSLALELLGELDMPRDAELREAVGESIFGHLLMLDSLSEMVALQKKFNLQALGQAQRDFDEAMAVSVVIGMLAVLVAVITASYVVERSHEKNRQLSYQALHDALTGLPNRLAFEQAVSRCLDESRQDRTEHVLLFMDLDQFKLVNDTKGHQAGDRLLQELARNLSGKLRRSDLLARLGGDEFGVLLRYTDAEHGEQVAEKLRACVEAYELKFEEETFRVGVSIGMTPFEGETFNFERLLSTTDASCYVAKDSGRNRIHRSDADSRILKERSGEIRWATRIQSALADKSFELHGQIMSHLQADGANERIPVELLIRMRDADNGSLISPGEFLPAAERYGLMTRIDGLVIDRAVEWIKHLGDLQQHVLISVNICGRSASDPEFVEFAQQRITGSDIDPASLCLEITESVAVHNLQVASNFINRLGAFGCQFALDDFGAGVSSFNYLRNLQVGILKIDGSYIRSIESSPTDATLVECINSIAHALGKRTVAEFVETESLMEKVRELGLDYAQGFVFHRPAPLAEVERRLADQVDERLREPHGEHKAPDELMTG